ncbi:MAG: tetratricopeptide repeat protein [Chitinophagaceae bacterium]|nr:tetratricopeptide repeat protein [Chitinophagaceae bacterium]
MKKLSFLFVVTTLFTSAIFAQAPQNKSAQETAKAYVRDGDYNNAIIVLNKALQTQPDNLELQKDLAFAYYLKKDFASAVQTAKPLADRADADVPTFQVIGLIYKALEETKEAEKLYRIALKKFPSSGVLYNEYGEMLWAKKNFGDAVKQWEKGIQEDPNNSGNYYNAAKYYYFSPDKTWGLIYGEMFVNIESFSARTAEIKTMLLDGYKKVFSGNDILKNQDTKNPFSSAFLSLMQKNNSAVAGGINPETLTTLRARFTLDWFEKYATKFPHRLFDHHHQMIQLGMFDAYNQWLFGATANPTAYQKWVTDHSSANDEFVRLQKSRVFKIPAGQYYQTVSRK